ncbi:MAG: YfhO family protein [Ruminococcus sp.]|nr:YfhO family protein [Ruminococcus sp.]
MENEREEVILEEKPRRRKKTKKIFNNTRKKWNQFKKGKCYYIMYEKGVFYFLLSFLIPAAIMTLAFADNGIHPFGDRQMLVVDLWHQYFPFFRVVREKLLTGGSFLYSWQNGLGTNFLSLISYYAASPLNWISIFFDADHVRDALTFILIAKIGFSGAFFSSFLRYTYHRKDFSICIFSVMYALCSYTLGYYWNVMWFDTIALFPLVMLGIVAICREGKWKTFTFALALSLVSNYYIAFFTCIFSVFMFAASGIIEFKGVKLWFHRFWIMLRSSVLAIALGAFMLLPAYFGLQLTYSANNKFPEETSYYEKWTDILGNMLSYNAPTKVDGLPNFACGMLAIVLFGVFLLSFGIKIREKISALVMLAVIVVSCNMNKLNFIWHGFHFTNQIPYRFAFIFSFVLAAAAFRAYDILLKRGIKVYQLILMLFAPTAVFYLNYMAKGKDFIKESAVKSSMIVTGAFLLIFLAAKVFPFKKKYVRNTLMSFALAAAVFSEFVCNARLGVETVGTTQYDNYPTNYKEAQSLLSMAANTDDSPFYRTEMTSTWTLNDSSAYGYYGLSQFSSAANVSVTTFCKRLGLYASEAGNRYYYRTSTPVVNSLMGIKYLIKKNGYLNSEEMAMEYVGEAGSSHLYRNKYPLSIGFMMDEKILNMQDSAAFNPFEYQNSLLKLAAGIDESVFNAHEVASAEYNNIKVSQSGYGNYSFSVEDSDNEEASVKYTFNGFDGSYLYGYASANGGVCDNLVIECEGKTIDSGDLLKSYPIVFPMGDAQVGETSTVKFNITKGKQSGNYKLVVYTLRQETFEKAYNNLADEQLEITSFGDTEIEGKINAFQDGVMFLSIPYEKGWSVYIDGEKAETVKLMQSMLGVRVSAGEHDIRLKYVPEGFTEGVLISGASLAVILLLIWFESKKKKKKLAALAEKESADAVYVPEEDYTNFIGLEDIYDQAEENKIAPEADAEVIFKPEKQDIVQDTDADGLEGNNEESESNNGISGN